MALLIFLVEEASMRNFIEGARSRLPIPEDTEISYRVAAGIQNLRPLVEVNLRKSWPPGTRFVVLCDKDKADCHRRKSDILDWIPLHRRDEVLVRIVCYELESWYFGDHETLSFKFPRFARERRRARFRGSPDELQQPSVQMRAFTGLGKTALAESLAPELNLEGNTSHSLQVFLSGLQRLLAS